MKYIKDIINFCVSEEDLIPYRKSENDLCFDLRLNETIIFKPNELKLVHTWTKILLPEWYSARLYARSSTAKRYWLILANWVWVIDNNYRWEIMWMFYNIHDTEKEITKYTRLLQLEIFKSERLSYDFAINENEYDNFEEIYKTTRWKGWFWSTWIA